MSWEVSGWIPAAPSQHSTTTNTMNATTTDCINITAMLDAGFSLDDLLDGTPADIAALFELFPAPSVTITTLP